METRNNLQEGQVIDMGKYQEDAAALLELIGGKNNIQAVTHCMTRMRFVLGDAKKADIKQIEQLPAVKGTFTQAGQFQVIIGNDVAEFYQEFTSNAGIEGVNKEAAKQAAKGKQNVVQRIMSNLGEIFAPIIPALICGGLILGFRNIIGEINFFENGTKSLADISQFWAGVYSFLWLIGEAVFHLLPVGIVWSITKKMGTTQILGIILGLTLVSSQLLNGFSVASTDPADIPVWDFGFAQVEMIGYQGQVISAILAGFVLVYLEKFFRKICPAVISMIVVPFCSLVPAVIIAHTIVGPIGWKIGDAIATVVYNGLTSNYGVIFAGIFGLLYAPVVMTGLHHMTNAIDTTLSTLYGGTILWPMIALSNIAQGSAVLGMAVLQRKNNRAKQINIPALISCYLGVTEPALFGVNLKYVFPLICGMIGSALAAIVSIGFGVQAFSIGVGGIPGILSIKSEFWGIFLLCMAIAIVVPFVLTLIIGKKKLPKEAIAPSEAEEAPEEAAPTIEIDETVSTEAPLPMADAVYAPVSGKVIPIEEVPDDVFSQQVLGDGVGIEPTNNIITAPCDAEISVVMDGSNHACGLKLANDMELLIHVGINTVEMNGDGFTLFVGVGDRVKKGDKLIGFTPEKIRAAGYPTTTVLCVTDEGQAKNIQFASGLTGVAGETKLITWE